MLVKFVTKLLLIYMALGIGEGGTLAVPPPFAHRFLFRSGFRTPRLTRYTEAARIAPSAKCPSGVATTAK